MNLGIVGSNIFELLLPRDFLYVLYGGGIAFNLFIPTISFWDYGLYKVITSTMQAWNVLCLRSKVPPPNAADIDKFLTYIHRYLPQSAPILQYYNYIEFNNQSAPDHLTGDRTVGRKEVFTNI
ncbi:MAG: hypothetical protein CVU48_06825 [Candidatus Cloacimonetes bacterium HGW-Cloacimonetes-1]|jgi:hypothetical protein|nr:MAG: hypothetical protein CVU48_06825 [Candidatus Cloacimonetes bacterium HGW-Cloacimonetes-1]